MCGIVGVTGENGAQEVILSALKRLEYRGYDSAGIATVTEGTVSRRRAPGKIENLEQRLAKEPLCGRVGIGHTRWATHGAPTEHNAHPHMAGDVAVVHNGIIENHEDLKKMQLLESSIFESETDSEIIAHLVSKYFSAGSTPLEAVRSAIQHLEGAFALAVIFPDREDLLIAARRGSPLAVGYGEGRNYVGSDALALSELAQQISYLEDGDIAEVKAASVRVYDSDDHLVSREKKVLSADQHVLGKGSYRHFMAKEIHEQPSVLQQTIDQFVDPGSRTLSFPQVDIDFKEVSKLNIVACGTAYLAGFTSKYWFEQIARLPVEVDIASEYRYRNPCIQPTDLTLSVSQSGETADTLAAATFSKSASSRLMALVNVQESSLARAADDVLMTLAGPEIGVASTKAFTTQLVVLALLALKVAQDKGVLSDDAAETYIRAIRDLPHSIQRALQTNDIIEKVSQQLAGARDVIYLGRGAHYPIALEGALKLKEITYIHAEGYAAGELKHGPIALIEDGTPVIIVAPKDRLFEKTISNMQEVIARGAKVILVTDADGLSELGTGPWQTIEMPKVHPFVQPIVASVPIQLLAYHTAVKLGTDVDQPRNLAKSVTVE